MASSGTIPADVVEGHLGEHPAVAAAAVIGLPDGDAGERPCAVVLLRPGFGASTARLRAELPSFLQERGLPTEAVPARVEFSQSLPRTADGAVDRSELTRWFSTC